MSRIQESEPQQQVPPSFRQRYRASKNLRLSVFIGITVIICTVLTVLMFTILKPDKIFDQSTPEQIQATFEAAQSTRDAQGSKDEGSHTNSGNAKQVDDIVAQVLLDMNKNGWDTKQQRMLINWRRDDLRSVNCGQDACEKRDQPTRGDAANDLRLLQNMYWYAATHPNDTSMNAYITRVLPVVKKEYGETTSTKGWLYYTLLRLKAYSNEPQYWDKVIQNWAEAQFKKLDTTLSVYHGQTDTVAGEGNLTLKDAYRVDHALETGLALYDAGTRYQRPDWMLAGRRGVDTVIKQAYNKQYHLFGRIYLFEDERYGKNMLFDTQARMGETGQEIEALMRTGAYTKNQVYLDLAKEMLDGLVNSPLHDKTHGGFYFKLYLAPATEYSPAKKEHAAGELDRDYKETRQLHLLSALHLANQVFNNRWSSLEQEMLRVGTERFFLPAPVPGYTYRVTPDGKLFACETCKPAKTENWITSEADNIALEALQTVLHDKIK